MDGKKFFSVSVANLRNATVDHVKMPYKLGASPLAVQQKSIDTNIQIELTRRSLKNSMKTVEGRAEVITSEPMDNIAVKDLIYGGKDPIFMGEFDGI